MTPSQWLSRAAFLVTVLVVPAVATIALDQVSRPPARFTDAAAQAAEFIGYSRSLELDPAQRRLRDRALSAIAAPCCAKFSMATCCCPCNLAKSVWGLSNFLIIRRHADAAEVERNARAWIAFINPRGFTGDVCDSAGGCSRRFSAGGCGGMDVSNLSAAR